MSPPAQARSGLSIEKIDRDHRKNPFVGLFDSMNSRADRLSESAVCVFEAEPVGLVRGGHHKEDETNEGSCQEAGRQEGRRQARRQEGRCQASSKEGCCEEEVIPIGEREEGRNMRPKPWTVPLALAAYALLSADLASAISLTNRDVRDHKISVLEAGSKVDHPLAPGASLEKICLKGCIVRLNDSENDEYELEGDEVVSIEEGYLYYDGPEASSGGPESSSPQQKP